MSISVLYEKIVKSWNRSKFKQQNPSPRIDFWFSYLPNTKGIYGGIFPFKKFHNDRRFHMPTK